MKKIYLLGLSFLAISACSKKSSNSSSVSNIGAKAAVTFVMGEPVTSSLRRELREQGQGTPSAIVLTITDAKGNAIIDPATGKQRFQLEQLQLNNFSGTFITSPITLSPGDYVLTQFLVLNEQGETYASTPVAGSELAALVRRPLNIAFSVKESATLKVVPEVVMAGNYTPAQFGYTTFSFVQINVTRFVFVAQTFDITSANFILTKSHLKVVETKTNTVLYDADMPSANTKVLVNGNYDEYKIYVTKSGNYTYIKKFSKDALNNYFITPLSINLTALKPGDKEGSIDPNGEKN